MPYLLLIRRRPEAVLFLLLCGCVVGLSLQVRRGDGRLTAEGWALDATGVLVRAAVGARETAGDVREWFSGRERLRSDNHRLRVEVSRLEGDLLQMRDAAKERDRLLGLLGSWPSPPPATHAARLVSLTASGPFHSALLDRGNAGGIGVGGVVVGIHGVLGRVVAAGDHAARVQLLTDRLSAIGVVLPRSGRVAVARGDGGGVALQYVPTLADVREGDAVLTAGTDGIYPKDMPVGKIREVRRGGPALLLDLPVQLAADPKTESLVFVLPPILPAGALGPAAAPRS